MTTFGYDGHNRWFAAIGPNNYDPLKASRITLLLSVTGWTLGRLLIAHGGNSNAMQYVRKVHEWGMALGDSKLLFQNDEWGRQLLPHMLFKPGADWQDE